MLSGPQAADRAGISYNAWKLTPRTRLGRPAPDAVETIGARRVGLWSRATIDAWRKQRSQHDARAATLRLHVEITSRRARGFAVTDIGVQLGLHRCTVSRHLHDRCRCASLATRIAR